MRTLEESIEKRCHDLGHDYLENRDPSRGKELLEELRQELMVVCLAAKEHGKLLRDEEWWSIEESKS